MYRQAKPEPETIVIKVMTGSCKKYPMPGTMEERGMSESVELKKAKRMLGN